MYILVKITKTYENYSTFLAVSAGLCLDCVCQYLMIRAAPTFLNIFTQLREEGGQSKDR